MKHIKKGKEPDSFTDWKALENEDWIPSWDDNFQTPEKRDVHSALLREQGSICCYCGMRIAINNSHIEHLKPRRLYPNLALDYANLLASCQGESKSPPIPIHCGHKKKDWYDENLFVSPLETTCTDFFTYTPEGEIQATDEPEKQAAAIETIRQLGLNIDKLRNMREQAIEGILLAIDGLTEEEIQKLAQAYEEPDTDGYYTPFCGAIAYILKQYFST